MIISSQQRDVQAMVKSQFEVRMVLTIRNLQKHDVGTYKCVAKNSLGDVESSIRLYGECILPKHFRLYFIYIHNHFFLRNFKFIFNRWFYTYIQQWLKKIFGMYTFTNIGPDNIHIVIDLLLLRSSK